MKVIVTDHRFESLDLETAILGPLGCEVVAEQCNTPEDLIARVADADCLITQFAPINAAVIDKLKHCRVIVRYGVGVDNVDVEAARRKGIPVCNVPDYCMDEVADHALALILGLTRQIVAITTTVRSGVWKLPVPLEQMRVLKEMTVGIVGYGRIGREVASRLHGFKAKILVYDPGVAASDITRAGYDPVSLDELFQSSDLVTLHCPSTAHTKRMISRDTIDKMKKGALLVNVARGDLVDSRDLISALRSGRLGGAALDVTDPEPINAVSPLLSMPYVLITNHVAAASVTAIRMLRTRAAETVARAIRGEPLPNIVNGLSPTSVKMPT
ncbi:MAG TPA: C-terminal binding protein [Gemmataceae bacterium]|nr:C-terminal binding protein [Gemmataceae bacterium]